VVEKSLKMFLFFYYISIISLTFDENGGEKVNASMMIVIHLKINVSNI
jgi:hypothetical protein